MRLRVPAPGGRNLSPHAEGLCDIGSPFHSLPLH
jgi:hypothetical protein